MVGCRGRGGGGGTKPVEDQLLDGPAAQQVFVNNALQGHGIDVVIPDAVGVDSEDRPAAADAEAASERAFDPLGVVQLAQPAGLG